MQPLVTYAAHNIYLQYNLCHAGTGLPHGHHDSGRWMDQRLQLTELAGFMPLPVIQSVTWHAKQRTRLVYCVSYIDLYNLQPASAHD